MLNYVFKMLNFNANGQDTYEGGITGTQNVSFII